MLKPGGDSLVGKVTMARYREWSKTQFEPTRHFSLRLVNREKKLMDKKKSENVWEDRREEKVTKMKKTKERKNEKTKE